MTEYFASMIRQELVELQRQVEECRRDVGIERKPAGLRVRRSAGLLRKRLRDAR